MGHEVVRAWSLDHPELRLRLCRCTGRFKGAPHSAVDVPRAQRDQAIAGGFDGAARLDLELDPNPTLLCMTDALGERTLRMTSEEPERLSELLAIRSEDEFTTFVVAERVAKRMRIDDSTLAILRFDEGEDAVGVQQP